MANPADAAAKQLTSLHSDGVNTAELDSSRDRKFESDFLQGRVCELSVPGQREITVASSGRVAYASNTGHDSLSAANCAQVK